MENHKEHNLILGSLLVVLVLVGAYLWFRSHNTNAPKPDEAAKNVEVTTSIAENGDNKTPEGFPEVIPVEKENLKESSKAVYTDQGLTQYTVSYTSARSKEALIKIYSDFYTKYGFSLDTSATNKSLGQFSGTSFNDTLSVVISTQNKQSYVQLNLLHKE